ncbi:MAG: hypothetical protein E7241_04175 [Lachnospiraceae bacterium]|jgi:hypothetical protein|nr:hypothetical protein [Lachnospiraceae bacterium]
MKTKHIPVMVVLIACAITLVLDIVQGFGIDTILKDLLIVLVIFFIIGFVAKFFLDRAFNPPVPDEEEGNEEREDFPVEGEEAEEAAEEGEPAETEEEGTSEESEEMEEDFY